MIAKALGRGPGVVYHYIKKLQAAENARPIERVSFNLSIDAVNYFQVEAEARRNVRTVIMRRALELIAAEGLLGAVLDDSVKPAKKNAVLFGQV